MKKSILAAAVLALGASFCSAAPSDEQDCASWRQEIPAGWSCLVGDGQAPENGKTVVISDAGQWKKFWTERSAAQDKLPSVDFSRDVVVAALGDGSGASFKVFRVSRTSRYANAYGKKQRPQGQDLTAAQGRVDSMLSANVFPVLNDAVAGPQIRSMGTLNVFDGAGHGLGGASVPAAPPSAAQQPSCTPGVDCPEPQPRGRGGRQPGCTPGVDCPDGDGRQPGCTPGVDCPGDGRGNGDGSTPLPPNYRPRPNDTPGRFPARGNPPVLDRSVDVAGFWHTYVNLWGQAEESAGDWTRGTAEAVVERGGREVGTQGTSYTATLKSRSSRNVYRLYWRYVGYNCDPNDSSRCVEWRIEYTWFYDRAEDGQARVMDVQVQFNQDQPLLPWEKERLVITYDGNQIGLDRSGAAFQYSVRGPLIDQQRGVATIELAAGARILRQPEADKVSLSLVNQNGRLQLVLDDKRDSFYAGEPLELTVEVKKDSGSFWHADKVAFERTKNGPLQFTIQAGRHPQAVVEVPTIGSGKYYIKRWSFRRAQSKISNNWWIDLGKGNTVQY